MLCAEEGRNDELSEASALVVDCETVAYKCVKHTLQFDRTLNKTRRISGQKNK